MSYSKEKVESILNNGISRRSFLKGLAASGVLTSLPGGILHANEDLNTKIPYLGQKNYQTFRNACPRNCYDTCSIKTYVKDGVMQFIEGAQESTYTRGGCCVKGNSYVKRVYSARRLKYPMMQVGGKGSGNWKRISWDYAMETIAKKLLEMKKKMEPCLVLHLPSILETSASRITVLRECLALLAIPPDLQELHVGQQELTRKTLTWAICGVTILKR